MAGNKLLFLLFFFGAIFAFALTPGFAPAAAFTISVNPSVINPEIGDPVNVLVTIASGPAANPKLYELDCDDSGGVTYTDCSSGVCNSGGTNASSWNFTAPNHCSYTTTGPKTITARVSDGSSPPVVVTKTASVNVSPPGVNMSVGTVSPTSATEGTAQTFTINVIDADSPPEIVACDFRIPSLSVNQPMSVSGGGTNCNSSCPATISYTFPPGSSSTSPHAAHAVCANSKGGKSGTPVGIAVASSSGPPPPGGTFASLTVSGLIAILESIGDWVFAIGMLIAVIMVIIGATMFLTGGSDPARLGTGKKVLLWAGVGVGLMLVARGVFTVLRAILGA